MMYTASMDARIRDIDDELWAKFKNHCYLESLRRGEDISLNKRLKEMIFEVVNSDEDLMDRLDTMTNQESRNRTPKKSHRKGIESKATGMLAGLLETGK